MSPTGTASMSVRSANESWSQGRPAHTLLQLSTEGDMGDAVLDRERRNFHTWVMTVIRPACFSDTVGPATNISSATRAAATISAPCD